MVKGISKDGYLTKKGYDYFHKKTIKKLEKEGYLKNGKLKVRFDSSPKSLKKGDLVITFEIMKVAGKYDSNEENEFSVVSVLPTCSTLICNKEGCGHECIKHTGFGQQGITKLLKR